MDIRKPPRTTELFSTFALIGLSAVGMGVLQAIRSVPVKHGWMSQEEIDEGLGLVQLYPGAIMVDLIAYIGYRLAGIRGSILSVLGFITPSLVMLLGLSWAYFKYGSHPEVSEIAIGLVALVVGVILNMTIDFAIQHARTPQLALVAFGAFAIEIAGFNVMWAVLGSLLVGGLFFRSLSMTTPTHGERSEDAKDTLLSWRRLVLSVMPGLAVAAGATVAALLPGALPAVTADMSKIGSVAFGNGTAIIPILQQDAIAHHWLVLKQFSVGVGLGQVTPGPFLSTAAFVGYAADRWWGGIVGGLAIYAPSVAMTMVAAELYPVLHRLNWVRGAIAGVMAAFTGLLAGMVLILGKPIFPHPPALILAGAALVAVRSVQINILLLFASGLAVWVVYLLLSGTI